MKNRVIVGVGGDAGGDGWYTQWQREWRDCRMSSSIHGYEDGIGGGMPAKVDAYIDGRKSWMVMDVSWVVLGDKHVLDLNIESFFYLT